MRIDLHNHTRASDGELSPAELVDQACQAGLSHLGITDHDTVAGLKQAAVSAAGKELEIVPGLEITAELHGRELHILGLFVVPNTSELEAFSSRIQNERSERLKAMTEKLKRAGLPIEWEDVLAQAPGVKSMARPHLAKALLAKGLVSKIQEAFDRYLTPRKPGWVERYQPTSAEAIALIHRSGGIASLAHPGENKVSPNELKTLREAGLDAVEAFHPSHPPSQAEAFIRWGKELGMESTGGSDFHSGRFGHRLGTFTTPKSSFIALRELAARRTADAGLKPRLKSWHREVEQLAQSESQSE